MITSIGPRRANSESKFMEMPVRSAAALLAVLMLFVGVSCGIKGDPTPYVETKSASAQESAKKENVSQDTRSAPTDAKAVKKDGAKR